MGHVMRDRFDFLFPAASLGKFHFSFMDPVEVPVTGPVGVAGDGPPLFC